jgi:hypothetical protein
MAAREDQTAAAAREAEEARKFRRERDMRATWIDVE